MRRNRVLGLVLVGAMSLATTGCVSSILRQVGPLGLIMVIFGAAPVDSAAKPDAAKRGPKRVKFKNSDDVEVTGSIGGLSGSYDLDIGEYGNIEGTADIKGSFRAKVKSKEFDSQAASVVEAAVLDRFGVEVEVTSTKIKYAGRQTSGGVKKIYNARVSYRGTVLTGEHAGRKIKGSMKFRGKIVED